MGKVLLLACSGIFKVLLGKTGSAASIHMNYTTCCQGAFADGFHDESAAFSDHARDDIVLTP
jgi:hypothetical protein